jgi:hypothetical protein
MNDHELKIRKRELEERRRALANTLAMRRWKVSKLQKRVRKLTRLTPERVEQIKREEAHEAE